MVHHVSSRSQDTSQVHQVMNLESVVERADSHCERASDDAATGHIEQPAHSGGENHRDAEAEAEANERAKQDLLAQQGATTLHIGSLNGPDAGNVNGEAHVQHWLTEQSVTASPSQQGKDADTQFIELESDGTGMPGPSSVRRLPVADLDSIDFELPMPLPQQMQSASQFGIPNIHSRSRETSMCGIKSRPQSPSMRSNPQSLTADDSEPFDPTPLDFCPFGGAEGDTTQFVRISSALPYLLCTEEQQYTLEQIHQARVWQRVPKASISDEDRRQISSNDKALLSALMLANHPMMAHANRVFSSFEVAKGQIKLWKDVGDSKPEEINVSFKPYLSKILDWQRCFNSIDFAYDMDGWMSTLNILHERGARIEAVPGAIVKQLMGTPPDKPEFERLCVRAHEASIVGIANHRRARIQELGNDDSFSYHEPAADDPSATPYSLRFSHVNPKGNVVTQEEAQAYEHYQRDQRQKLEIEKMKKKALKARGGGCCTRSVRCCKWTIAMFLAMCLLAALLMGIYFRPGERPNGWNQR
ncbi:hypothetical protein EJ04DRAFT_351028 [Polyplosphaeria fusca]|uniref:Uncharacterized protein n=1 Tax=Polyplosphaeria fusca TaxID=682080 RepID=A0A9P4UXD9_9PLEO|nr:hypothetical protein EJ04DRAFT_351028 [Polyplosphaeria fusca]